MDRRSNPGIFPPGLRVRAPDDVIAITGSRHLGSMATVIGGHQDVSAPLTVGPCGLKLHSAGQRRATQPMGVRVTTIQAMTTLSVTAITAGLRPRP